MTPCTLEHCICNANWQSSEQFLAKIYQYLTKSVKNALSLRWSRHHTYSLWLSQPQPQTSGDIRHACGTCRCLSPGPEMLRKTWFMVFEVSVATSSPPPPTFEIGGMLRGKLRSTPAKSIFKHILGPERPEGLLSL
jgi:hypothetical protein